MLLLAVLIQMLALKLSILTRCTEFFRFSLVILIPNVLMSFRKKERMLLITACVTLFTLYFVAANKSNLAGIIPYEFITFLTYILGGFLLQSRRKEGVSL